MEILRAGIGDVKGILELLLQVNNVHAEGRPDLFVKGERKYSESELRALLQDDSRPVFAAKEDGVVVGYCFCVIERYGGGNMVERTTLYIDDLCVREGLRGQSIGSRLYEYALAFGTYRDKREDRRAANSHPGGDLPLPSPHLRFSCRQCRSSPAGRSVYSRPLLDRNDAALLPRE